jgi:WD40 repeat protein
VLHRDVKPANVLFDEDGNSYLADFGIAIVGSAAPRSSGIGTSPRYSPPERLAGLEDTEASDQYGLALVVWELLTGESPYRDDEPLSELVDQKRRGLLPPLAELRPEVPAAASAVLQRATAGRPTDRFADVAAFVAAWRDATSAQLPARSDVLERARSTDLRVGTNPYVGLRAFAEADANVFFGRDSLAEHLTNVVCASPVTAVVGASGSGKSSLIHAGLVPRLRRGDERVATMVPGDDPAAQLRLALLAVATREPRGPGPAEAIRSVAGQGAGALTVVIDQFEELWTLTPASGRERFLGGLADLLDGDTWSGRVRLVVAIRADFYDRPLDDPHFGRYVAAHSFPLTPMTAAELHEAVTGPATASSASLGPGLASEIVAEVLAHRAGLPLLQFTLAELYARRATGAVMTREAYQSLGGISGALAARAEQVYDDLSAEERAVARRLLLRLVVPGEGAEDTRRRLRRSELSPDAAAVADRLGAQRLLVGDRDPATREPTVELAHESLLRAWPRLAGWLDEDREARVELQHLEEAARGWDSGGRPESELYRGGRLETAGELARSRPEDLGDLEVEFVQASETSARRSRDRDRAQRRRLRRALVGTAVALVVALAAATLAVVARGEADERADDADLARLVSTSQSLVPSKRDVAALLAVAASEREPGPATDSALLHAVYADPSLIADLRPAVRGADVDFGPDSSSLFLNPQQPGAPVLRYEPASATFTELDLDQGDLTVFPFQPIDDHHVVHSLADGVSEPEPVLRLVDTETGEIEAAAELSAPPFDVAVSPDGDQLVVTTFGTPDRAATVEAFEIPSLEPIGSVSQPGPTFDGPFTSGSAWVDDERVAVGSPTGRLLIWRPSTGEVVQRLNDPPVAGNFATELQVTEDGSTLVAGGFDGAGMLAFDLATGLPAWPEPRPANPIVTIDERHGVIWAPELGFGSSKAVAFDLRTGEPTGSVRDGQHGTLCDIVAGDDDRLLILSSCNEASVSVWSLDGGTPTAAGLADVGAFTGAGNWTADRSVIVNEGGFGGSYFVDLDTGARHPYPEDDFGPTHFAADGRRIRFERTRDRVVIEQPGRAPRSFDVPMPDEPENMAVALDGSIAAIIDARTAAGPPDVVTVIDVDAERVLHTIESDVGGALSVAVSPDGRTLVVAGGAERAEIYDVETGGVTATLERAANAAFSPDGSLLATNAFNGTIAFYDADTLDPEGVPLTGATAFTNTMQFTADGRVLATAGLDNTLRFWDVATRQQLGPGIAVTDHSFAVAPEGAEVAASTPAGVQRFTLERSALREAACRIAGRELSAAEWERHIGGAPRDLCGG